MSGGGGRGLDGHTTQPPLLPPEKNYSPTPSSPFARLSTSAAAPMGSAVWGSRSRTPYAASPGP